MLKIVKDSVLKVSRSLGYDIVPLREMKERDFALHLRELLTHLRIDCVLDVGVVGARATRPPFVGHPHHDVGL